MLAKLQLFICIFAAVVTCIVSILQETPLVVMVFRLIFVIILFYFLGLIVRFYLRKKVFAQPEADELETDQYDELHQGPLSDEERGLNK